MLKAMAKSTLPLMLALFSTQAWAQTPNSTIKKVTLFVNYGEGAILHSGAIESFKNTLTALSNEKNFELTISEKSNSSSQRAAALANLKNVNVALFANIGLNSFQNTADQAIIQDFFMKGGKAIGFHASIDHHQYWKWWEDLHSGGSFQGHGNNPFKLTQDPQMKGNAALQKMWTENALGDPNISETEIYTLTAYPRGKEGVTMMQVVAPPNNAIPVHDFTWLRKIGSGGEYIFTCLGHGPGDFTGGWMQKAIWGWMRYLNGDYNPTGMSQGKMASNWNSVDFSANKLEVRSAGPYSLKVMDVRGATVLSTAGQGIHNYNLAGLQPGLYFVKVQGSAGTHSLKAMVK